MNNKVRIWIGVAATIALSFAFWMFFKSSNIRHYIPENATICVEFNLKQIFQKIDLSDPNQTKDIADFFNNEMEEDPSLLVKIFKNIANNPGQSGIDFSISPIYAQLNNQSNLVLFAINSRSKLNQLLAKQENPEYSMQKVDSIDGYQVVFDYPNDLVMVFNNDICVCLQHDSPMSDFSANAQTQRSDVQLAALKTAMEILNIPEEKSLISNAKYQKSLKLHDGSDIHIFLTSPEEGISDPYLKQFFAQAFKAKQGYSVGIEFTKQGIEIASNKISDEKISDEDISESKVISQWQPNEFSYIGQEESPMILAGIVDLSPTKKSTTQDNTTKEVNPIPAVPGTPESEYEEYNNPVNPYLYQLLNASWLNKASLAKIFNGKFAMAIHELKNQNNQWQFSFSVYLGTKNKEKSKELLALVQKFTALVDPNFNTQVKNDVVYCQLPESDGLANPLNQVLGSITAVASGNGLILHIGNSPFAQKLSSQLQKNQKFSTEPSPATISKITSSTQYVSISPQSFKIPNKTTSPGVEEPIVDQAAYQILQQIMASTTKIEFTESQDQQSSGGIFFKPNNQNILHRAAINLNEILRNAQQNQSAYQRKDKLQFKQ